MLAVTGYTDRWAFRGGEEVRVHLSSDQPVVHWRLLRHFGPIHEPSDWTAQTAAVTDAGGSLEGIGRHHILTGSFFSARLDFTEAVTDVRLALRIMPTRLFDGVAIAQLDLGTGWIALQADANGNLLLAMSAGPKDLQLPVGLAVAVWQDLTLDLDLRAGFVRVAVDGRGADLTEKVPFGAADIAVPGYLHIAGDGSRGCFDGKIESPELFVREGEEPEWQPAARWDFGCFETHPFEIVESLGKGATGHLRNAPTRAVTSSRFEGRNCDFTTAARGYDAVWFHADDLGDAGWPVAFTITLPDLPSGAYSIVVSQNEHIDWTDRASFDALPIFIGPSSDRSSRVALVLPTFSYRAYANNTFAEDADPRIFKRKRESRSKPLYETAIAFNLLSLYSLHFDGSGVALATLKRPQLTTRADFDSQLQGFPHQFSADLEIVGWLEQMGMPYDILSDEMLHEEGPACLRGYDVVITGSHPEYSSAAVLDAYDDHVGAGGSIMYLGGNGFYWSVGLNASAPELIEVRRSEGTRTWTAGIGERRQQLDGADGGIWRSLGRPPNATFGIGFSAHGFSGDGTYVANAAAHIPTQFVRVSEFFTELGSAHFGIAGLELDRHAVEYGSPRDTEILASVDAMPAGYLPAVEEFGGLDELIPDAYGTLKAMVRGDIVLKKNPNGGHVFSVGSIRWTSGLCDVDDSSRVRSLTSAVLMDLIGINALTTERGK